MTVCRNAEASIARTIESVRGQQYSSLEYIVIDGASTDSTPDIVRAYGSLVDVFVSEPDNGIADAFNKGISRSTGDIVGLINADDQLCPGTLETICNFFRNHPDVDVVHGDVMLFEGSRFIKRVKPPGRWWYPWRLVLFNHPSTFVRKSVYENHGLFDTNYRIAMDVEIFLRWMSCGVVIKYLPQVLATMETGGVSGQQALLGYREARQAFVQHGYSALLATMNYLGKLLLWSLLVATGVVARSTERRRT